MKGTRKMNRPFPAARLLVSAVLAFSVSPSARDAGLTVEALRQRGGMPLSQGALESFVVGNTVIIRNLTDGGAVRWQRLKSRSG